VAANKLVSQIASKLKKPWAFEFVPPGSETGFLHPLANNWLPGIGPKTANQLNAAGLARVGQVAHTPIELLELLVGSLAPQLKNFSWGIDPRPIIPSRAPAKSYSEQETFPADTTDEVFLEATLHRMADSLMAKVRADAKSIRTVAVKVRYNDMDEEQTSESLCEPTDLETDIYSLTTALLRKAWRRRVSLRLVSLKLSNVYESPFWPALDLDPQLQQHTARQRLAAAADELRQKLGRGVLLRGHDFTLRGKAGSGEEPEAQHNDDQTARRGLRALPHEQPSTNVSYNLAAVQRQRLGHSIARLPVEAKTRQVIVSPGAELRFRMEVSAPGRRSPSKKRITTCIPLNVHSYYSFLDSTLSIDAIVEMAKRHELPAIALTDSANLHGAVQFAQAANAAGIKPIIGTELVPGGSRVCLYVENQVGYRNLCRILNAHNAGKQPEPYPLPGSTGEVADGLHLNDRAYSSNADSAAPRPPRRGSPTKAPHPTEGFPAIDFERFDTEGLLAVSNNPRFAQFFPGRFYLETNTTEAYEDRPVHGPCLASLPAHYELPSDRWKHDLVQSIRTLTLLRQQHPAKRLDGQYHFRTPAEMQSLYAAHPELLANSLELAERCNFSFLLGRPQFPNYRPPDGSTPAAFLRRLVMNGLRDRYPKNHLQLEAQLEEELAIITEVGYEEYFLVMWDILQECGRRGIEWITRGSAADSLACYCLGISSVCPIRFDLYFRRFLNKERMALNKLPDIDVDFAHDRKDDVIDLIFEKYRSSNAAVVGGFSTFQSRSAFAEVAKVLGVSDYQVRRITERFPYFSRASELAEAAAENLECRDLPLEQEPYSTAMTMARFLDGFPRYAKMHPCGLVLSRQPMDEITPCFTSAKGYPTTHFDMDSVEAVGLIKMDILAQGGLAVMRDVKQMLSSPIHLESLEPWEDPQVWDLIASGGARAVHHIESPAMISLCKMCNVRDIDTLIAIVSVIRPGAANESKKMEFARRYQGLSPVRYPHPTLEPCLRSTYGLVVYEEHILQICESFAGLPPGRADILRRALGKDKTELIEQIAAEFADCARKHGRTEAEIAEVWGLVVGFKGYAFCKAHSTAYGVEAYQSAWLKRYYPAEFMAGVLSNGKGFYHPLVYILECHRLGIPLLPPCINEPGPAFTVHAGKIRVPALLVKGLSQRTTESLAREHARRDFRSLADFYLRVRPSQQEMEALLQVGAFDCFGQPRTTQYWEFKSVAQTASSSAPGEQLWLLPPGNLDRLPSVPLAEPNRLQRLRWEEELMGYAVSAHPLDLYPDIAWETYCPINQLGAHLGQQIVTCGLVIEQRMFHQVTGEPMKFLTIADYTGVIETELFAKTYKSYGLNTVRYRVLELAATVEAFENGRGYTLRVVRAGKPRNKPTRSQGGSSLPDPIRNGNANLP
jgi:DNA-directed DNA polymerase III PolC